MAVYSGPKVVTDGMILHLDKYNEESYQGEPTVNLLPNPLISTTTGSLLSGWSFQNTGSYHTIKAGQPDPFGGNDAVLWEWPGHSTAYYPGINYTLSGLANTNTHTVSGWLKLAYGAPTNMQIILFRVSPWGYQVASPNLVGNGLTNEWVLFESSGTPQDTSQSQFRVINHVGGATPAFGMYIYGVQLEEKAHASKFVDGTRSATNGWRDLSGNDNHADLTSLTYSATNVPNTNVNDFSFNGSSNGNEITVPSSSSVELTSELTAEVWMNWESGDGRLFQKDSYSNSANRLWEMGIYSSKFRMQMWHSNGTGTTQSSPNTLTANIWYHLLMTFDGINIKMYENSALVKTISFSGDIRSNSSRDITIGGSWGTSEYHDGLISSVKLYNRALSAVEVLQNFNASKGRYGL